MAPTRPLVALLAALGSLAACTPPAAPADASAADASAAAADAPASNAPCSFNRDCSASTERCACTGSADCHCELGPRGTGRAGLDACTSGNDCASGLCVEGPTAGSFLCSDACTAASDCPATLPRCLTVASVGTFCARDPSATGGDAGVPGCAGECARTTLDATFGTRTAPFDRAQFGRSGADGLYVEAYYGGDPACPSASSPTPDRTLVISGLRVPAGDAGAAAQTEADGVHATLLDFRGTLTTEPLLRAMTVRATPRFVDPSGAVSFDLSATFPGGTVAGGFFAPHCDSLDGR